MASGDHQRREDEIRPQPPLRSVEKSDASKPTKSGFGVTKLLFAFPKRHRGKALELDASHDTLRVLGPKGEEIAVVDSEVALDHLLGAAPETIAQPLQEETAPPEGLRRLSKLFRVSARGDDGREYQGACAVVGRDAIFLEATPAPALGTKVDLTIVHTEDDSPALRMKGTVAWACPRQDEFGLGPGVGVTCTWHSPELAAYLSEGEVPPRR